MKNFKLFHFKFLGIFHFFIPSDGMANFFQILFQISKSIFFKIFHFPLGVRPIFFKNKKQKFLIQISKMIFFQIFSFQNFLVP
jgi:hypothetical protein